MNFVRDGRRFVARLDKMQALLDRKAEVLADQVLRHMFIPAARAFELTLCGDRDGLWFEKGGPSAMPDYRWTFFEVGREHPELAPLLDLLATPLYPGLPKLLGHLVMAASPRKVKRRAVRHPPRERSTKLVWNKTGPEVWLSSCGRYQVWIQARVRSGDRYEREYSSRAIDSNDDDAINRMRAMLCDRGTFAEAKAACQEHATRQQRST